MHKGGIHFPSKTGLGQRNGSRQTRPQILVWNFWMILLCHSEPVRSLPNGPERSEGAHGKLREESAFDRGIETKQIPPADQKHRPSK